MAITLDGLTGVTAPSVTATGNISGTYIIGNGALLTGVATGSSYANSNVADYLPTYTGNLDSLTGNIITTANITAAYILPQSNATTDLGSNTLQWRSLYVSNNTIYIGGVSVGVADGQLTVAGNTVVTEGTSLTGNIETTGNVSAGNLAITANITTDNLNVGTLLDVKDINVTGQILTDLGVVGNVNPGNVNVVAGNVSAQYLLGNGAFITGLPAGYSNAVVANYLASGSLTSNIVTTGNIAAGNIAVTSLITTDNLNVGTLLDVKDINMTGVVLTNFNVQGNISGGNLEVTQDAVILGNLRVQGNTTYINVTDLVIEDKDIIVGANASATLSDLNGAGLQIGNISAGGNITFFYDSTSNTMALSHGANIANTVGVTGNIDASGNISGLYLLGNGSQLTGISSGGATIADDTTTNSNYYPVFATATSGSLTTATISSTKLTFNPSTGQLTAVDVNTSSDAKYKENVQPIASALDTINSIQGVSFNWKETGQRSYGVIAQDLIKVLPELVHSAERGLTVSYLPLIAILVEAIKEQQQQIDQLKNTKPS
jgi:hypothetical protein